MNTKEKTFAALRPFFFSILLIVSLLNISGQVIAQQASEEEMDIFNILNSQLDDPLDGLNNPLDDALVLSDFWKSRASICFSQRLVHHLWRSEYPSAYAASTQHLYPTFICIFR